VAADEVGGLLEDVLLAGRSLELGLRLDHAQGRPREAGDGEAHAGELLPREGRRDRHGHEGRHRGEGRRALEGGPMGRAGDQHRPQDPAPGEVPGGVAQEAQGRALPDFVGESHDEHRVEREERGHELRVGVVVHGLAADRGHAPQQARGDRDAASRGEEARGGRVGDR
jgi:hypothetical protein